MRRVAPGEEHAQREVRRREGARGEGGEGGAHLGPRQDASEEREVPGRGDGLASVADERQGWASACGLGAERQG